jgi:hypothetical protein
VPTGNLCFNTLSITQTTPAAPTCPAAAAGRKPSSMYSTRPAFLASGMPAWQAFEFDNIFTATAAESARQRYHPEP